MARLLFDDNFEVLEVNPDGKVFNKVDRLRGRSDLYEMDLLLDINSDIYPVKVGERLAIHLSATLNLDGSAGPSEWNEQMQDRRHLSSTLLDKYEYVMHGKVFKYNQDTRGAGPLKVEVFMSFGGLLMQLVGDPRKLEDLEVDAPVYLLMRKIKASDAY